MGIEAAIAGATLFEVIGVATAVVGLGLSISGQRQQRGAQRSARRAAEASQRAQLRQQQLEQSRERRKQVREARVARARAVNAAVTQGVGIESTIVPGTVGGIQSQLSANLGFLSQSSANIGAINTALGERSRALSSAATSGAIASLGSTIFGSASTIARLPETIGTIFSPRTTDLSVTGPVSIPTGGTITGP